MNHRLLHTTQSPAVAELRPPLGCARGATAEGPDLMTPAPLLVSAIIPTLNEAANLPHVLTRIPACVGEVIIVDANSTDDTMAVARALMPDVRIVLQCGRGKGNALAAGFAAARGDIIVMLDADGSTDPAEIPRFLDPLLDGADFVKGTRFGHGGASTDITPLRRFGNRMLVGLVNVLFGTEYTDLCYGYSAFWSDCLDELHVDCDGFEVETLLNVRSARAGMRIVEVPSVEHERIHGTGNLNAARDGMRVLRTIVRERLRRGRFATADWRPTFAEIQPDLSPWRGLEQVGRRQQVAV